MIEGLYSIFEHWHKEGTVWLYSDPHFNTDEDLRIAFPDRPIVEEQIKMINSKVGRKDHLIILGDIGDIECTGRIVHQDIKQFAQLMQARHVDLLDHEHVHLQLGVHHFEQRCLETLGLEVGRIITVVEVGLEVIEGTHPFADLPRDGRMTIDDLLQRIGAETQTGLQVEVLPEGESAQVVGLNDILEVVVILIDRHDRRRAEDDMQVFVLAVTTLQFATPVGILEELIQEKVLSAGAHEF